MADKKVIGRSKPKVTAFSHKNKKIGEKLYESKGGRAVLVACFRYRRMQIYQRIGLRLKCSRPDKRLVVSVC